MAFEVNQLIVLIVAGVLAARAGRRLRIPEAIPLLVTGYVLGADMLGLWQPSLLGINLGAVSLVAVPVILFYDGLKTDAKNLFEMWPTVLSVTTLAVLITVAGIGLLARYILGLSWLSSLLLGGILSSTDAAAIVPVLRSLNVEKRVSTLLSSEAVLNDATSITIFLVLFGLAGGSGLSIKGAVAQLLYLMVASCAVGVLVGIAANEIFRKLRVLGDLTFASILVMLAAYGLAQALGLSDVISVVLAALVFRYFLQSGEVDPLDRLNTLSVWENLNFLAIALVFLFLGGQISLSAILPLLPVGLLISALFMLAVRPLTIFISTAFDSSFSFNEKLFVSWAGSPRGAVSAALASIVIAGSAGTPIAGEATTIFVITTIVILATIVVGSLTSKLAAQKLLGTREEDVEDRFRLLSTQLKAMMVAERRLREDWKAGLIPTKTFNEIHLSHHSQMRAIEAELYELSRIDPTLESRARAVRVKELLMNQIAALQTSYENKELSQDSYEYLLKQFRSQIQRVDELEERDAQSSRLNPDARRLPPTQRKLTD
jgi:cell volume regulation protein A